jgi:hypothetical protein
MPISKDEFNQGESKSKLYKDVEKFLKENSGEAYTLEEIYRNVLEPKSTTEIPDKGLDAIYIVMISPILIELESKRKITTKLIKTDIQDMPYFRWKK